MPQYIFIVGLPRTGTKLHMDILSNGRNSDCNVHLTHENFFLGRPLRPGVRQKMHRLGDMREDKNVHKLVDVMYSRSYHGVYWHRLRMGRAGPTKQTMLQRILDSDRSDRAIYQCILESDSPATAQTFLGDKNGPNLYHIPTLLEWFPDAKIIHTIRDPRAILASQLRKRDRVLRSAKNPRPSQRLVKLLDPGLYALAVLYITAAWWNAIRLHRKYQARFPENYLCSRFEDLIADPKAAVQRLSQFTGIPFQESMLWPRQIDSSFNPTGPAKRGGQETGFDKRTLTRWQTELGPWLRKWIEFCLRTQLREVGYTA